jgi:hypothetical protein
MVRLFITLRIQFAGLPINMDMRKGEYGNISTTGGVACSMSTFLMRDLWTDKGKIPGDTMLRASEPCLI